MKHASKQALASLESILQALRDHPALVERTPGSFYLRSSGFVHFHEYPSGLFADLKEDRVSFTRYRVTTRKEQRELISRVRRCLDAVVQAAR